MEKNFKNQTPPRSSAQIDTFMQHQKGASFSPPKFLMANNSPELRQITNKDETVITTEDRFTLNRINIPSSTRTNNQPIDIQNSPRLSVNSLSNQNFGNTNEFKFNSYDSTGGYGEVGKQRHNSIGVGNTRHPKSNSEMQNQFFNDLYNNSSSNIKNTLPIFIDDLEEETILDVSINFVNENG